MCRCCREEIRLKSLVREAEPLTGPLFCALDLLCLSGDQRQKSEAGYVPIRDLLCVGAFNDVQRYTPRLIDIARKEEGLRQGREGADAEDVGARTSRRDRPMSVPDGRAHVTVLERDRASDLHERLNVGRP